MSFVFRKLKPEVTVLLYSFSSEGLTEFEGWSSNYSYPAVDYLLSLFCYKLRSFLMFYAKLLFSSCTFLISWHNTLAFLLKKLCYV